MESNFKHFWCHNCNHDLFQSHNYVKCFLCNSELIEEVEASSPHPSTFIPQNHSSRNSYLPSQLILPIPIPIRFIQFIIQNPGEHQVAATEAQINSLENVDRTNTECAICQEAINGPAKRIKCKHDFHEQCIVPWLRLKNSCPICRTTV